MSLIQRIYCTTNEQEPVCSSFTAYSQQQIPAAVEVKLCLSQYSHAELTLLSSIKPSQ